MTHSLVCPELFYFGNRRQGDRHTSILRQHHQCIACRAAVTSIANCVSKVGALGGSEWYQWILRIRSISHQLYTRPYLVPFMKYRSCTIALFCYTPLRLRPVTEGFPWDDLHKILHGGQRMAKVQTGEEILPKVSTLWLRRTNVTDDRRICDSKDPNVVTLSLIHI